MNFTIVKHLLFHSTAIPQNPLDHVMSKFQFRETKQKLLHVSSISSQSEILVCGCASALQGRVDTRHQTPQRLKWQESTRRTEENVGSQLPFASSHVVRASPTEMRHSTAANCPMCVASGQKKEDTRKRGEGRQGRLKSLLANTTRGETFACRAQRCCISIQRRLAPHFVLAPL